MSKLYFRYGVMGSGKSALLLQVAHNYEEKGMKVLIIKPEVDLIGKDYIHSRIGLERKADKVIKPTDNIKQILKEFGKENISCLLVDEAQFFNREQIDELLLFAKTYDVPVICYGLKTDFKTETFEGSKRLFELADELEELATICSCGKKAKVNARKVNGEFVSSGDQVALDGIDNVEYECLCAKCYLEKVLKIDIQKGE